MPPRNCANEPVAPQHEPCRATDRALRAIQVVIAWVNAADTVPR
eukprot:CAMPEP_0115875238 /NCGR_PEP_ID=MMETSP0287-20121206/24990_1 /TAXON_ID=412157 /ORGANISM="Chrysochromulina rotalis, Strain UIO044" /LENGTH=43 /DNA_ID= /DNA_START= /DNA_END= /DNA_ORIENTATION=